jgi:hypothetical protein
VSSLCNLSHAGEELKSLGELAGRCYFLRPISKPGSDELMDTKLLCASRTVLKRSFVRPAICPCASRIFLASFTRFWKCCCGHGGANGLAAKERELYPLESSAFSRRTLTSATGKPVRATTLAECFHGIADTGEKTLVHGHKSQVIIIRHIGLRANPC